MGKNGEANGMEKGHVEAFKEWFQAKRKKWITNGLSGKNDAFCHSALLFGRNLEFLQMIGVFGSQEKFFHLDEFS